ncbi:two-component system, OmpR family, sensor histidine kinase QseC [Alysiella filiformis DSM 16848]|uniref:histidine kinase n=2 Tax=Alysiella TaxID=194195 RepID=A0A286EDE4_9NEIS|nr:HAMP domain-containing histidine kinase [Alysiella filiformis]SOD68923.1 two-component system, OmpR family, sensor histidine kinase QseC [Alysiella filiformis DSM 16848]
MFSHTHSIQGRLSRSLSALALLFALTAAVLVARDSYNETHEFQDDLLKQVAQNLAPNTPIHHDDEDDDDDAPIHTQTANTPSQQRLNVAGLGGGYHTILHQQTWYRVYIHDTEPQPTVVWQSMATRNELIWQSVLYSILPLLLLIPLFYALTWWVVRRTLAPIAQLSGSLKTRTSADLSPLSLNNIPVELHDLIKSFNHLLHTTEHTLNQQQRFIADAAHELRTPMTALSVQAERLQHETLPENLRQPLADLQQGIRRNRQLLEQLLQHARAQSPDGSRPKSQIAIQTLFRQVIQDLLPLAQSKMQDLGVSSEWNAQLFANETDLYILIKTLCDNAIRYTPENGQIDLSLSETDTEWIIHIEDNGIGIPPHERLRVFDPFYRILGNEQEGSGLGLAIAHTIAQNHDGKIELHNSQKFTHGLWVQVHLSKAATSIQAA